MPVGASNTYPLGTLTFEVQAQLAPGATPTVRISLDFYPH